MAAIGIGAELSAAPKLAALCYIAALALLAVVFLRADLFRVAHIKAWTMLVATATLLIVLWFTIRSEPPPSAREIAKAIATELPATIRDPTFVDANGEVWITLGGADLGFALSDLGPNGIPLRHIVPGDDEFLPILVSVKQGKLYADMRLSDSSCQPAVVLQSNRITLNPGNWDRNMNESALEVVDDNYNPMFQLVYLRPGQIKINGLFCTHTRIIYASNDGLVMRPRNEPMPFSLQRMFKYPAAKYPSMLENE